MFRRPPKLRAESWRMWLLARGRPLSFAIGMVVFLIYLFLFGKDG